ncbi:hypothetical protein [Polaribacter cellanae]|uniref:Uncharacterized protein n=1 Tax=Polaribacter cellanae TaxID=2818493 RepID=A0A975H5Q1_9FLAO|nr:hypothetical protein [Polaribacter cellanae]QTE21104.1 hypothetical protein J3359_09600 [Polaribacter cellanae]
MDKMIDLDLRGFKGTAHTLLQLFTHIARRELWSEAEITAVITEANKHNDHDHVIATILEYCKH